MHVFALIILNQRGHFSCCLKIFKEKRILPVSPDSFPVWNVFCCCVCQTSCESKLWSLQQDAVFSSLNVMQSTSVAARRLEIFLVIDDRQTKARLGASKCFPERKLHRCWPKYGQRKRHFADLDCCRKYRTCESTARHIEWLTPNATG